MAILKTTFLPCLFVSSFILSMMAAVYAASRLKRGVEYT